MPGPAAQLQLHVITIDFVELRILNFHHVSHPITCMYLLHWPISALGDKFFKDFLVSIYIAQTRAGSYATFFIPARPCKDIIILGA